MKASETKSEIMRQSRQSFDRSEGKQHENHAEAKQYDKSLGTVTATAVAAVEDQYIYAVDARAVDDYHEGSRPPPYPTNVPPSLPPSLPPQPEESSVRQYLRHYNWPNGLQSLFLQTRAKVPIRYFICDDSGSMNSQDGKHIVGITTFLFQSYL